MSKKMLLTLVSHSALIVMGMPALAQQASGTPGNVDLTQTPAAPATSAATNAGPSRGAATEASDVAEIIVTAQKRAQSVRDVGLSLNVASGDQLAVLGVRSTDDLVKIAPGLTFAKSVDGTPLYTLRGVGFNDYTLGSSPAVSLYVDQVSLVFGQFARGATLDLERVEVVKGPQGILFGQNATGGAINYIANKPAQELEAGGGVSYGRFGTFDGDIYLSGPISDTLAVRVAASTTQSGPWQQSLTRDAELGRQDITRGRIVADWKPSDRLTLQFNANGWVDHSETQAAQLFGVGLQVPEPVNPTDPVSIEIKRRITAIRAQPNAGLNARSADWDANRSLKRDDSFYQFSLRGDYELGDAATLTSISAYSKYQEDNPLDRDGTALVIAGARTKSNVKVFNQEIRLAGAADAFNWLVGGNYASTDVLSSSDYFIAEASNTLVIPGLPIAQTNTTITQRIRDYAGFANLEYKVTDSVTILAGGRFTKTSTKFSACLIGDPNSQLTFNILGDLLSGTTTPPVSPTDCTNLAGANVVGRNGLVLNQIIRDPFESKLTEDNVSWRAGVNYKPSRDLLVYALVSRGFKSGSFGAIPASTTAQFIPGTQEQLTAFEVGTKINALDSKLQFNAALFHYAYKDKQVRGAIIDPIFGLLDQIVNVPKSRINGAEADITFRPTPGLTLRGSVAYVDSKIQRFTGINNARVFGDFSGTALPFSPKWNVIGDINYEWGVGSDLMAFTGVHALYNSRTNATLGEPEILTIKPFTTVDVTAGIRGPDNRWTVSIYGRNVFNQYYWNNAYAAQDILARIAGQPVTYGASFRFNFR
jgi:outer membrane receptor protein involved in Fe transport